MNVTPLDLWEKLAKGMTDVRTNIEIDFIERDDSIKVYYAGKEQPDEQPSAGVDWRREGTGTQMTRLECYYNKMSFKEPQCQKQAV